MSDLSFVEFSYTDFCFAAYHKPSEQWVYFVHDEDHPRLSAICLTYDFARADKFVSESYLKLRLESSYLKDGFSKVIQDFHIVKFKKTYTMISDE